MFARMKICLGVSAALLLLGHTVQAATAVYPDNIVFTNAANAGNLLGVPDGTTSTFNNSDYVLLDYGTDISGQDLTFNFASTTSSNEILFFVLRNANGYVFSDTPRTNPGGGATSFWYVTAQPGTSVGVQNAEFASACAAAGGCTGVFLRRSNFSAAGGSFSLDAVGATPEPSTWALMVLSFGIMGWRLKKMKTEGTLYGGHGSVLYPAERLASI